MLTRAGSPFTHNAGAGPACTLIFIFVSMCGDNCMRVNISWTIIGKAFSIFHGNLLLYRLMDNLTRTSCRERTRGFYRFCSWFCFISFCVYDKLRLCEFCIWCKIHILRFTLSAPIPDNGRNYWGGGGLD